MEARTSKATRVMFGVTADDTKKILEAKSKLASLTHVYGYFDPIHYWSFPAESRDQCLSILASVFPDAAIHRLN
jgi:hypothetical protein